MYCAEQFPKAGKRESIEFHKSSNQRDLLLSRANEALSRNIKQFEIATKASIWISDSVLCVAMNKFLSSADFLYRQISQPTFTNAPPLQATSVALHLKRS